MNSIDLDFQTLCCEELWCIRAKILIQELALHLFEGHRFL